MATSHFNEYLIGIAQKHGAYTVSQAAELVGRSVDTLTRWRKEEKVKAPTLMVQIGQTEIGLYTDADIHEMKEYIVSITTGS